MTKQKFDDASTRFMILACEEANRYVRDTSGRMAEQVRFYLTMTTALLAGFFIIINSQARPAFFCLSIALICLTVSGMGFISFARLSSIKRQATSHFARAHRWGAYFLDKDPELLKYLSGEGILEENAAHMKHLPFTREIVFLLRAFALFNSLMLALCLLFGIAAVFQFMSETVWNLNALYITGYAVPVAIGFTMSFGFSSKYLNSQIRSARADYARILHLS